MKHRPIAASILIAVVILDIAHQPLWFSWQEYDKRHACDIKSTTRMRNRNAPTLEIRLMRPKTRKRSPFHANSRLSSPSYTTTSLPNPPTSQEGTKRDAVYTILFVSLFMCVLFFVVSLCYCFLALPPAFLCFGFAPDRSVLESDNGIVLLGIITGNLVELSRDRYIVDDQLRA